MPTRQRAKLTLRAALALAFLTLSVSTLQITAGASSRADVVVVAEAASSPIAPPRTRASAARRPRRGPRTASAHRPQRPSTRVDAPVLATDTRVLLEDRYLRHLAILC